MTTTKEAAQRAIDGLVKIMDDEDTPSGLRLEIAREILKYAVASTPPDFNPPR